MPSALLSEIVRQCQSLLKPETFEDWPGAVNGLQVQNSGIVTRIAATVDASLATVKMAVAAKADLLLTHHGLFWSPANLPWTGRRYELFELLIKNKMAVYSSHLPLDAHPAIGNNAQLAKALGLRGLKPFFFEKGRHIGFQATRTIHRDELARQLSDVLGHPPILLPGGPQRCRRIGIVTGSAGSELKIAVSEGVDTFITGEGPHWTHALAEDLGLNVFHGGHYATETFGVKALAARLSKSFKIPWIFLDHPSGL
jgi:dinuclear metal center YbgI/SA1388 family protein